MNFKRQVVRATHRAAFVCQDLADPTVMKVVHKKTTNQWTLGAGLG